MWSWGSLCGSILPSEIMVAGDMISVIDLRCFVD